MVTRTTFYADVVIELTYKEDGKVSTDTFEETIPKCDTKEKADMILEKRYKGKIVSVISCNIREEKRAMSDDDFYRYSKPVTPKEK